mmetsp:Transcript_73447/g.215415  ORF Transcript_73447/g.215415 Transcript_73447/m.215415 type:complete len:206 (+) Transcript_73447:1058-1675(+)
MRATPYMRLKASEPCEIGRPISFVSGASTTSTNSSSPATASGCSCLTCRPMGRRATSAVRTSSARESTRTSPSNATSCSGTGKMAVRPAANPSSAPGLSQSSPQLSMRDSKGCLSPELFCSGSWAWTVGEPRFGLRGLPGTRLRTFTSAPFSMPSSSRASKTRSPSRGKPCVSSSSVTISSWTSRSALKSPPRSPGSSEGTTPTR